MRIETFRITTHNRKIHLEKIIIYNSYEPFGISRGHFLYYSGSCLDSLDMFGHLIFLFQRYKSSMYISLEINENIEYLILKQIKNDIYLIIKQIHI